MKKYIAPVDFSEHSEYALMAAAKMARGDDSEIIAMHMLELYETLLSVSVKSLFHNAWQVFCCI